MEIIFTKQKSIISRLIRRITGEPVSHTAFIYMQNVYHANHKGACISTLKKFQETSEVVYRVTLPAKYNLHFHYEFAKMEGSTYDLPAAIYAGWRVMLNRYFGIKMPGMNKFNFKNAYLCTELAQKILKIEVDSMITPYGLYQKVLEMID
jgi:hypothetical protein